MRMPARPGRWRWPRLRRSQGSYRRFAVMIAAVTLLTACAAPQLTTLGPDEVISRSASIRSGTLANGLRYFIEPDVATPKRAEVWLVVEAGSLYEDADQRGAALLIERLAWQGTRRFSRKAIRRFLRNAGMREDDDFGSQTSYDRMLFKLQVPSDDIVDPRARTQSEANGAMIVPTPLQDARLRRTTRRSRPRFTRPSTALHAVAWPLAALRRLSPSDSAVGHPHAAASPPSCSAASRA